MFKNGLWKHDVSPRVWQTKAISLWEKNMRGIVKVATGGGKTVFALGCINSFILKVKNPKVIIVVPTISLQDQWIISLTEDFNLQEKDIESKKFDHSSDTIFHVLVINTARNLTIKTSKECLLVVDECHRAASEANSHIFKNKFSGTLGLSATPERQFDNKFEEVLVPHLGGVFFEYGIKEALAEKVLSPFSITNVKIPLTEDEYKKYQKETKKIAQSMSQDQNDELVKMLLMQRARTLSKAVFRVPFAVKIALEHHEKKIIIFHESIRSAEAINKSLNKSGLRSVCYHSKIGENLRRDNLRLFKHGLVSVVVCCRALDEGINVPDATIGIVASSTTSSRQRIQRLGRILRPSPGKELAMVYTLYATPSEKKRLESEEENLQGVAEVTWVKGDVGATFT